MNKIEFITELSNFDLVLKPYSETQWTIGTSRFANIMMGFNPQTTVEDYSGGVTFKTINASLFTGDQIKEASKIVHEFLMTPLSEREVN